ncbi:putative nucleotidyltransferase component of viral defense system [Aminobacter aganoensis]|uniref:Putative nucleotidyltransferase component of viral defense system n=1 Tax=Aminobacter aganoensis TaxID=83264 RepID=A0A7X0KNW0_9HYPH|nr:putative nucleotidyltransferase component of viral defense system [Aminobacter aganoensis]
MGIVITKLVVRSDSAQVLRGSVVEPDLRPVSSGVQDEFGFAEMRIVSFPDLYAGKIVAAFDRLHQRDLFDARDLLARAPDLTC